MGNNLVSLNDIRSRQADFALVPGNLLDPNERAEGSYQRSYQDNEPPLFPRLIGRRAFQADGLWLFI